MMRPDGHLGGNTMNLTVIADFEDNGAKSATRPPLSVALSLANRVAPPPLLNLARSLARTHHQPLTSTTGLVTLCVL